jgi:hypothetical protein
MLIDIYIDLSVTFEMDIVAGCVQQFLIKSPPIIRMHTSIKCPFIRLMQKQMALPNEFQFSPRVLIRRPRPGDRRWRVRTDPFHWSSFEENDVSRRELPSGKVTIEALRSH